MNSRGDQGRRSTKKRWRAVFLFAIVLVSVGVLGILGWQTRVEHIDESDPYGHFDSAEIEARIESESARIRDLGYPATAGEMSEWYDSQPGTYEGAELIEQAFTSFVDWPPNEETQQKIDQATGRVQEGYRLTNEELELFSEVVGKNDEASRLFREGAKKGKTRFALDFTVGNIIGTDLMHQTQLLNGARLLSLEALVAVRNGEVDRALGAVETALRLRCATSSEPFASSQVIGIELHSIAWMAFADVLNHAALTEEQLHRSADFFQHAEVVDNYVAGFAGHLLMLMELVRLEPPRPLLEDHLRLILVTRDLIDSATKPYYEVTERLDRILKENDVLNREVYRFSVLFAPSMITIRTEFARVETEVQLSLSALAIEEFRLAEGRLPESLGELVGLYLDAVPIDPHGGKSLRYVASSEGYTVYSLGQDGLDDGGLEDPDDREKGDIVLRVRR